MSLRVRACARASGRVRGVLKPYLLQIAQAAEKALLQPPLCSSPATAAAPPSPATAKQVVDAAVSVPPGCACIQKVIRVFKKCLGHAAEHTPLPETGEQVVDGAGKYKRTRTHGRSPALALNRPMTSHSTGYIPHRACATPPTWRSHRPTRRTSLITGARGGTPVFPDSSACQRERPRPHTQEGRRWGAGVQWGAASGEGENMSRGPISRL